MAQKLRILVTDGVSPKGVEALQAVPDFEVEVSKSLKEDELLEKIKGVHAIIVRSATKVRRPVIEAADCLKVIGRAGVGVDNVDVDAATEKGVVVMNTPGGNTISTAEHSFSMLLSMARNIPQAHCSMKEGRWDRKSFLGTEVNNKVLGVIGMGRIGSEVSRRAFAFGMRVLAYDPYLSVSRARALQVELFEKLEEMLPLCDFLTLHMPLTPETRGILSRARLELCKKGVRIVNCARGGLIDEGVLYSAIKDGLVGGAAMDVYEQEPPAEDFPLRELAEVVLTPHLGASTQEAQEGVGIEIAESIRDYLSQGTICNAVNMPNVDAKTLSELGHYLKFGSQLGEMLAQLTPNRCDELTISYCGKISDKDTTSVTRAILKGFLSEGGSDVNEVNVVKFAESHGVSFKEVRERELSNYSDLVCVRAEAEGKSCRVAGTFFGTNPRIVIVNDHHMEVSPEGVLLILENEDKPGIVGWIGSLLGRHSINIANMALSRSSQGSHALSILNLDSMPSEEVLGEISEGDGIASACAIQF